MSFKYTRFEQQSIDKDYLRNMEEVTEYFIYWFEGYTTEPFIKMLIELHKLASFGGYTGHTNCEAPMVIDHEFRGTPGSTWRPILKKSWFSGVPDTPMIVPNFKDPTLHGCHYLLNKPEGYELYLPNEDMVPTFLGLMAEAMEQLKNGFSAQVLANYIHYFVVGHPCKAINFSICMAQVNVVLYLAGRQPIYHEHLDFACFVYDYDRIENIFVERVTWSK